MTDFALDSPDQIELRLPAFLEAFGELEDAGEELSNELAAVADSTHAKLSAIETRSGRMQLGALIGFGLFQIVLSMALIRYVARSLRSSVEIADKVASGNLTSVISTGATDEFGELFEALDRMQRDLAARDARDGRVAAENLRVRRALDTASAPVMLVDDDQKIIYQNEAALRMWRAAEPDLRVVDPAFDAGRLAGGRLHQIDRALDFRSLHASERRTIRKGSRTFQLAAGPVLGAQGRADGDRARVARSDGRDGRRRVDLGPRRRGPLAATSGAGSTFATRRDSSGRSASRSIDWSRPARAD
jgi:PAS domain-containing protein